MAANKKVNWGVLSTANIGLKHVIPAMLQGQHINVLAIASRDMQKAKQVANQLGIAEVYADYDSLLTHPDIEAIYNPLPNHLHIEYTIKALKAGKHVLCEKPVGLNASQAKQLMDAAAQFPKLKVMEAFMYRFHLQWKKARAIVNDGLLGEVKTMQSFFSYFNVDDKNIRNKPETGGGALMDIGCYCISFPRFIFGREPQKVVSLIDFDLVMQTDRLTSGILDFGDGITSSFTCSTQLDSYQRVNIFGSKGRLEIEIPVNAIADETARMWLQVNGAIEEIIIEPCNQYTLQCDAFSKSILYDTEVPTPLTDALNNMKVIDAMFKSAELGRWEKL